MVTYLADNPVPSGEWPFRENEIRALGCPTMARFWLGWGFDFEDELGPRDPE